MRIRRYLVIAVLLAAVTALWAWHVTAPLVTVHHVPARFEARAGAFTANITGSLSWRVTSARWRLDDVGNRPLRSWEPRVPSPDFVVEIPADRLDGGEHRVILEARSWLRPAERRVFTFFYDPDPPRGPIVRRWSADEQLDVQDGHFERIVGTDGTNWVRPVPGSEGWDRTLVVAGAFEGARRVTTRLLYRYDVSDRRRFGFGVLPLWGGRPDTGYSPARGWRFGILWYYGVLRGIGTGFSERIGNGVPRWVTNYRDFVLEPGRIYRVVVEAWPETGGGGTWRWWIRGKWWPADEPEPEAWLAVSDDQGSPLPDLPYGVALFAHYSQVEFGETVVEPLEPPWPQGPLDPWPGS